MCTAEARQHGPSGRVACPSPLQNLSPQPMHSASPGWSTLEGLSEALRSFDSCEVVATMARRPFPSSALRLPFLVVAMVQTNPRRKFTSARTPLSEVSAALVLSQW